METISSSEARNNFAAVWDMAKRKPIVIRKQKRDEVVMMSREQYDHIINDPVRRFREVAERIGKSARRRGLTDKEFDEILAQDD